MRFCLWVIDDILEKKVLNGFVKAGVVIDVADSSKCSFTCICGIFWPLNPSTTAVYVQSAFYPSLHFTLSLQSAFYTQSAFYPWSAVCSPQSTFYTDRFCILSNGLDYPLEKKMSSVRTALAIRSKENCHPFERLRLSRCSFLSND